MSTRLFLVRHGATAQTAEDRFSGAEGVELSDDGRAQAQRLGERLRGEGIYAVGQKTGRVRERYPAWLYS